MSEELSLDTVMTRRFELDELISLIAARHKTELDPLTEELKLCETFIRSQMLEGNMQQFKSSSTGHQTYFTTKDKVTVRDMPAVVGHMLAAAPPPVDIIPIEPPVWQQILNHIQAHGLWGLLNNAVNKTACKELIEANAAPPGIEYSAFRDLAWKRGKA